TGGPGTDPRAGIERDGPTIGQGAHGPCGQVGQGKARTSCSVRVEGPAISAWKVTLVPELPRPLMDTGPWSGMPNRKVCDHDSSPRWFSCTNSLLSAATVDIPRRGLTVPSGVRAPPVIGDRDLPIRMGGHEGGARSSLALCFFVGMGEHLEDEMAAATRSFGSAQSFADLGEVLDVEIDAPVVGGDCPGRSLAHPQSVLTEPLERPRCANRSCRRSAADPRGRLRTGSGAQ